MKDNILQLGHGPWHSSRRGDWHQGHHLRGRRHGSMHGRGWPGFFGSEGHEHGHGRGPFWGGLEGGHERMERGMLRYIILDVLRDGPKHGYEIIKQLEERTQGRYSPSPGTLYPTLQYLEDLELVRSEQEEGRRVYQLTDSGRAELDEHANPVERFWSRFHDRIPSGATRSELNFLADAIRDLTRTVMGGMRNAMHAGDVETVRKVRLALERCQNEVREIIAQSAGARSSSNASPDNPKSPEYAPEETLL